jgi:hypothetical protein
MGNKARNKIQVMATLTSKIISIHSWGAVARFHIKSPAGMTPAGL